MPSELKNLILTELSLVDNPANPMAMAPIFKSETPNGEDMTEETEKMAPEMDAKIKAYMKEKGCDRKTAMNALMKSFDEVEALKAEVAKLKEANEALRKSFLDEGYEITAEGVSKKAPVEFIEFEGEKINKSDIPPVVLKRLEANEIEKREAEVKKKAQEAFPNLKEDLAVALIKADFSKDLLDALAALDEMFGAQMDEIGKSASSDGDLTDPTEKLNALAKAHAAEKNITFAKAYAEVVKTDAGKALIKKIYKEG